MIAFGFLILIIGIWVLINTFNGNLPGLINIPGLHDATTGIRGLTTQSKADTPTTLNQIGVQNSIGGASNAIANDIAGSLQDVINAVKGVKSADLSLPSNPPRKVLGPQ